MLVMLDIRTLFQVSLQECKHRSNFIANTYNVVWPREVTINDNAEVFM